MAAITDEQLLAALEDLLVSMPSKDVIRHEDLDTLAWWGRAKALVNMWQPLTGVSFDFEVQKLYGATAIRSGQGYVNAITTIQMMRSDLILKTRGVQSASFQVGQVFDYLDSLRSKIHSASSSILLVDPYLNHDVVSRYLNGLRPEVVIRLLSNKQRDHEQFLQSLKLFSIQNKSHVQLRYSDNLHDRFVFIDDADAYQSGASFKDGGKKSPTSLTQIIDIKTAVRSHYESLWANANPILLS